MGMFSFFAGIGSLFIAGGLAHRQDGPINERRKNFKVHNIDVTLQNQYRTSLIRWYTQKDSPSCPYKYPDNDSDFRIEWWAKYKAQEMVIKQGLKPYDFNGTYIAEEYDVWEKYRKFVTSRKLQEKKLWFPKDI